MNIEDITARSLDSQHSVKLSFGSADEFVKYCQSNVKIFFRSKTDLDFYNRMSFDQTVNKYMAGDIRRVEESEKFLDHLQHEIRTITPRWVNSQEGAYPDVPAYLSGAPESMRKKIYDPNDRNPVKVFVSLAMSAGVDPHSVLQRGLSILCLVRELSNVRPVSIYGFSEGACNGARGITLQVIDLTSIIDSLSRLVYVLSAVEFYRYFCLGLDKNIYDSGGYWAFRRSGDQIFTAGSEYRNNISSLLQANEQDLVIPPMYLHDPDYELWTKAPHEWVQRELDKFELQGEQV